MQRARAVPTLRSLVPARPLGGGGASPAAPGAAMPSPPPDLPPRATADGTLRRLQEAALEGFGERGYHGVSIRELAEAAGITVSSVYAHVKAKEDLLTELALVGHLEHNEQLRTALLGAPPEPRRQIDALVHAHVRFHATYPLLARVANRELHALSADNGARVLAVRHASEGLFLDVIQRGIAQGVFTVPDGWLAVAAIGALGLRVAEWYTPESGYTPEQIADAYALFAVRLLMAQPGEEAAG
jgi:AcrR family transcriptional regulator